LAGKNICITRQGKYRRRKWKNIVMARQKKITYNKAKKLLIIRQKKFTYKKAKNFNQTLEIMQNICYNNADKGHTINEG
jgi:hypothetical protein